MTDTVDTRLPTKPDAVAHVSDAHWEAALESVLKQRGVSRRALDAQSHSPLSIIDHARCLILLNEVPEPFEVALEQAWLDVWDTGNTPLGTKGPFKAAIRKHLAGMTIPEATQ